MARSTLHKGPRLGTGGLAEIHQVTVDGRRAVLKTLSEQATHDQDAITRLDHEGAVTAGLAHPNIRTLISRSDRSLVLEHLDLSLADVLHAGGALPIDAAVYIVRELLRALDYLHGQGRIHRDVKTANVLLTMDGAIKLADFETSKELGAAPTTGFMIRGTLGYMSPEQLEGGQLDERSDVFSAGVVLYELLTGHRPFGQTREAMLVELFGPRPPRPAQELRPELRHRERLIAALDHMLERSRAERCATPAAALEALPGSRQGRAEFVTHLHDLQAGGVLGGLPALTEPTNGHLVPSATVAPGPPPGRGLRLAISVAVVALALVAAVVVASPLFAWPDTHDSVQHDPPVQSLRARMLQRINRHYHADPTPSRPVPVPSTGTTR